MSNKSKYEQETIITFNEAENIANIYTHNQRMIRTMDELMSKSSTVVQVRNGNGWGEYNFPKKWVKVKMPRQLSEQQRSDLAKRARENFHGGNANE